MSQWQVISTAPTDGTVVLAITMEAQTPKPRIAWLEDDRWMAVWKPEKFVASGPHRWWPTHWMPLPSPPNATPSPALGEYTPGPWHAHAETGRTLITDDAGNNIALVYPMEDSPLAQASNAALIARAAKMEEALLTVKAVIGLIDPTGPMKHAIPRVLEALAPPQKGAAE